MLALSRHHPIRQHHFKTLVERISAHFVLDEEVKLVAKFHHELGTRGDRIRIEEVGNIFTLGREFVFEVLRVLRATEAAGSLLVHFCAGSHTVHSQ